MSHNLYLLMDSRIIDRACDAGLVLGDVEKDPANPLTLTGAYTDVMYDDDEKVYKTWYGARGGTHHAYSSDGIVWEKPKLGAFEVDGSFDNNVVHQSVVRQSPTGPQYASGMAGVFKDPHDPGPNRRYKALLKSPRNTTDQDRQRGRNQRM